MALFESQEDVYALFKRLDSTADGRALFALLEAKFLEPSLMPNAAVDGKALQILSNIRIGEHNVVRFINKYRKGTPHDRSNTD